MSLLIARDYANTTKPLWLSSQGGTMSGNLVVNGTITASGQIASSNSMAVLDASGNVAARLTEAGTPGATSTYIQGVQDIKFGKIDQPTTNTTLTLSAPGANLDALSIGGSLTATIGPIPTQIITSTKTVNPVAVSPAAPSQFGVDTTIAGIANAEYDVQVTGTVYCVSGTPDAADYIVYTFTSGGGQGSMSAIVYPTQTNLGGFGVGALGPLTAGSGAASINMRARVSPNASGTTLGANVRAFLGGGSTAVYGATLTICDVQRVR